MLALLLACLQAIPSVISAPAASLKQVTRTEVVARLQRGGLDRRQGGSPSSVPCTPPVIPSPPYPETATEGTVYTEYYYGIGYTENPNNPANYDTSTYPPVTQAFANTDVYTAIDMCASIANASPTIYFSFDLSFFLSTCQWSCTAYFGHNKDASQFNVVNPDVYLGYGYDTLEYGG